MLPILLAGGAAAAAFFLTGCASPRKVPPRTTPPRPDPPEPKYTQEFDHSSEVYKLYLRAKRLVATDSSLDVGCNKIFYSKTGDPTQRPWGKEDKKIQACEVYEHILDRWDLNEDYNALAEGLTEKPIPWSLDYLGPKTKEDAKIQKKAKAAIAFLDETLHKQKIEPASETYHERRILGLLYLVAYPGENNMKGLSENIAEMQREKNPNVLEKNELAESIMARGYYEKLAIRAAQGGLHEYMDYLEREGSFFLRHRGREERTALEAIKTQTGECTENSKVLYALLNKAGYNPHFFFVDIWKTQHPGLKYFLQENPLYDHVAIGFQHEGKDYTLDPSLPDPDIRYEGAKIPLTLRQYLALDYSNQGMPYYNADPPQFASAERAFKKGLQFEDSFIAPYLNMSNLLHRGAYDIADQDEKIKQLEKALKYINRAISINPAESRSYFQRAKTQMSLGNIENALLDIEEAIKLNPNVWRFYFTRAQLYFIKKNPNVAVSNFAEVIRLSPKNGYQEVENFSKRIANLIILNDFDEKARKGSEKELGVSLTEIKVPYQMGLLLEMGGHAVLAREKMEDLISKIEKAKKTLDQEEKQFSPNTITFLKLFLEEGSGLPAQWADLTRRIENLTHSTPQQESK